MFTTVSSISCTLYHSICISTDYNVYSFGYNKYGAHGHEEEEIIVPKQINNLFNIKTIACGDYHCVCLSYDGDVFSFGLNENGQLGIGKELKFTHIPQKINIEPCKQVFCGGYFTICLLEDNNLYSFGDNYYGYLGLGNNTNYNFPQLIPDLNDVEFVVCGGNYTICKTYNNEFYSWGKNDSGQLGQTNNDESYNKPIRCNNWPDNIIDIKCGYSHTLLLTEEGQVYSFGKNVHGQLGINKKNIESINIPTLIKDIPEIQRIECGYNHSMCIDINNNLWLFGYNSYAQLGLGDKNNKIKPIMHPTLSNIMDLSSRGNHTFVKTLDNKIYAFGNSNHSQLGFQTSQQYQLKPIQVLIDNEDIWCSKIGKSKQKSARK